MNTKIFYPSLRHELNARCPVPKKTSIYDKEYRNNIKDWLACRKKVRKEIEERNKR